MRLLLVAFAAATFWACAPDPTECSEWAQEHPLPGELAMWTGIFLDQSFRGGDSAVERGARRDLEKACLAGECWPVTNCEDGTPAQLRELERLKKHAR